MNKATTTATAGCIALLSALLIGQPAKAKPQSNHIPQTYADTAVVVEINGDEITTANFNGIRRTYLETDADCVCIGDLMAETLSDEGTPENVYDDAIVDARYCGWAETFGKDENGNPVFVAHDVNCDGKFDFADVQETELYVLGKIELENPAMADANGDGRVNDADVQKLYQLCT